MCSLTIPIKTEIFIQHPRALNYCLDRISTWVFFPFLKQTYQLIFCYHNEIIIKCVKNEQYRPLHFYYTLKGKWINHEDTNLNAVLKWGAAFETGFLLIMVLTFSLRGTCWNHWHSYGIHMCELYSVAFIYRGRHSEIRLSPCRG